MSEIVRFRQCCFAYGLPKSLKDKRLAIWRPTCQSSWRIDQRASVIVYVLIAGILLLVAIAAVSSLDFTDSNRR